MILVLLGTNPYSFSRLARAADDYAGSAGKEMFIQLGNTDYIPLHARYEKFLSSQELMKKIAEAELVIAQGGFGSIADCLLMGKRVVAVPRMPEFRESPDRQEELVRELEKLGRVSGVYDIRNLPDAIDKAMLADFQKASKNMIPELINQFLADN